LAQATKALATEIWQLDLITTISHGNDERRGCADDAGV